MNGRMHYDGGGPENGQVHARSTEPAEGEFITETEAVGRLTGGGYRVTRIIVTPKAQPGGFSQFDAYAVWEESQPR